MALRLSNYTGPIKKTAMAFTNDPMNRTIKLVMERN